MQAYLSVKNFGKIEEANINISNFSIFVGNNNSGKSYMMQLIYGVIRHIRIEEEEMELVKDIEETLLDNKKLIIDEEKFKLLEMAVNQYLKRNKEKIVYEIFQSKIKIDELEVHFELEEDVFQVRYLLLNEDNITNDLFANLMENREIEKSEYEVDDTKKKAHFMQICNLRNVKKTMALNVRFGEKLDRKNIVKTILNYIVMKQWEQSIYLPASRTGLMLLYRNYFADKADKQVYSFLSEDRQGENELGLTIPVYEFLRFLQTMKINEKSVEKRQEIMRFIEEHIIDGHVDFSNPAHPYYSPQKSDAKVPLYLASSMVNEIAPIFQVLMAKDLRKTIIWDEIETSLHPSKQVEMARLLNRLNNAGYKLIVSTHSDTMATKINNLLMFSFEDTTIEKQKAKLEKLNLSEEDLLHTDNVHVYQFVNKENGKSTVTELEFQTVPYVGYNFSQFNDNVMNLYEESKIIMGLDE